MKLRVLITVGQSLFCLWMIACCPAFGKDELQLTEEDRAQLSRGEIPASMRDHYRFVDETSEKGRTFQAKMEALEARLVAPLRLKTPPKPVRYLISDVPEIQAFYYGNASPPIVCLSRGFLAQADTLDEIAYVLGHELTHKHLSEEDLRSLGRNSKGEEYYADLLPV